MGVYNLKGKCGGEVWVDEYVFLCTGRVVFHRDAPVGGVTAWVRGDGSGGACAVDRELFLYNLLVQMPNLGL